MDVTQKYRALVWDNTYRTPGGILAYIFLSDTRITKRITASANLLCVCVISYGNRVHKSNKEYNNITTQKKKQIPENKNFYAKHSKCG